MKARSALILTLAAVLVGTLLAILVAAQAPPASGDTEQPPLDGPQDIWNRYSGLPAESADLPGYSIGITQINSSTVEYVDPTVLRPAAPLDLCFAVAVVSPDLDYMDRFEVDLPDTWAVSDVYAQPATGCDVATIAGVETGQVIYWQTAGTLPSGCGAWDNGSYLFCANITVPDCTGEPWRLPWTILGDGYGNPPHQASGTSEPMSCPSTGLYLWPEGYFTSGCHSITENITLNLWNHTGVDGTFDIAYDVPTGNATLTGPDQIYLGQDVDQDLLMELTPRACLPAGERITATITAQGAGYSDTSTIAMDIVHGGGCPTCPSVCLPIVLSSHN
jgi:hypothetical protein